MLRHGDFPVLLHHHVIKGFIVVKRQHHAWSALHTSKAESLEWPGRTNLAIIDVKEETITRIDGAAEHAQMG